MFFLSKFLPLLILPLGLSILLLGYYFFSKSKIHLFFAFSILLIFSNGICSALLWKFIESPWKRMNPHEIDTADAIVVLSGGGRTISSKTSRIFEWNDPDRFLAGLSLFDKNRSQNLIFTAGFNPYNKFLKSEGNLYKKEAIKFGIPEENIYITGPVKNTLEEVKEIKNLIRSKLFLEKPKIILVTSAYHMKRAKNLIIKENIDVIPYPVDFRSEIIDVDFLLNPLNWIPNSKNLSSSSSALRELIGRIAYKSFF